MKVVVTLPTYNEAENIRDLIAELRGLACDPEVVVADDNSPDGTWKIVDEISRNDAKVHLLRRMENKGRGYAGAAGFVKALEMGADRIVEMDADFSHQPRFIPALLDASDGCDVVIGSRLVKGGEDVGRPLHRRVFTKFSCWFARTALGLKVRDANSGFRVFTGEAMKAIDPGSMFSAGPSIVHEVFYKARIRGQRFCEVPITFVDRVRGTSSLSLGRLMDGWLKVLKLRWLGFAGRL